MRLDNVLKTLETNETLIIEAENTMDNSYDIILENEDYTIGKVIEYMMYIKYFEGFGTLNFCAFKKYHPHNTDSLIRIAYKEPISRENIIQNIKECIEEAKAVFINIHQKF
jgi:DNA-directed RNA polymerase subunit L